jgi:hypothetical protein
MRGWARLHLSSLHRAPVDQSTALSVFAQWIYIDDSRVKQAALMPGQVLQIGALRLQVEFTTGGEAMPKPISKPKGSVTATQPMKTIRPEPPPPATLEKPWWRRLFD